jgi:hypothetical protein
MFGVIKRLFVGPNVMRPAEGLSPCEFRVVRGQLQQFNRVQVREELIPETGLCLISDTKLSSSGNLEACNRPFNSSVCERKVNQDLCISEIVRRDRIGR